MKRLARLIVRIMPRLLRRRRFTGARIVERVSEIPSQTGALIYVVERNGNPQWAVFDCPCRTGHRLSVNLRATDYPHWTLKRERDFVTLSPSLWYRDQCHSHFWIKQNRVKWVRQEKH